MWSASRVGRHVFRGLNQWCFLHEQAGMRTCSGAVRSLIVCCFLEWWEEGPRGSFSPQRLLPSPCGLASFTVSVIIVVIQAVDSSM